MHAPGAASVIDLWERGENCSAAQRALVLLAWALPDRDIDALADWDLGLRDWHLLQLRRALFGPRLDGYTDCPACGERLEIDLDARRLQDDIEPPTAPEHHSEDGQRYRLPSSRDLIAIDGIEDVDAATSMLIERCALEPLQAAPSFDTETALAKLAAERGFRLDLTCAACGEQWPFDFDPAGFLWEEIRACVAELLDEVHELASAYGWSERAVLAMSATRRAAYLSRIQ
jgi:hypothetical protein